MLRPAQQVKPQQEAAEAQPTGSTHSPWQVASHKVQKLGQDECVKFMSSACSVIQAIETASGNYSVLVMAFWHNSTDL